MEIRIKDKILNIPIIQGGMGIGVSKGLLAGKVAQNGGAGTLSFVNCGYCEDDFYIDKISANKRAFLKELKIAKDISKGSGMILVNIMNVVNKFKDYIVFLNNTDVDGIVVGAGLPLDLPKYVGEDKIIAPVISSARALNIISKKWQKLNRKPDFVVFEGPEAGGHLGFKEDELQIDVFEELKKILDVTKDIPVFIGGGFGTAEKIKLALSHGATGVQIGTGFLFTEEANLDKKVKSKLLKLKNMGKIECSILNSPVGLLARGLNTTFVNKVKQERVMSNHCIDCIKTCKKSQTQYCINDALINAIKGDMENGLFFCGTDIDNFHEVISVDKYMDLLRSGYE